MHRKILPTDRLHESIRANVLGYHADIVAEVEEAIQTHRIVVVGMRWNDAVRRARRNLTNANLAFKYIEYGSYTQGWRKRLALKMWTGWPTFPMVFVDQQLVGGNSDLQKLLAQNQL